MGRDLGLNVKGSAKVRARIGAGVVGEVIGVQIVKRNRLRDS
jgi:hypothetical protein